MEGEVRSGEIILPVEITEMLKKNASSFGTAVQNFVPNKRVLRELYAGPKRKKAALREICGEELYQQIFAHMSQSNVTKITRYVANLQKKKIKK